MSAYHFCPACGASVYKSAYGRHLTHCASITRRMGTPQVMAARFRENKGLLVSDLQTRYPFVGTRFFEMRLKDGGIAPEEMTGRTGTYTRLQFNEGATTTRCVMCEVHLGHPIVAAVPRKTSHLCGWCEGDIERRERRAARLGAKSAPPVPLAQMCYNDGTLTEAGATEALAPVSSDVAPASLPANRK